jgi:hypothetical protein
MTRNNSRVVLSQGREISSGLVRNEHVDDFSRSDVSILPRIYGAHGSPDATVNRVGTRLIHDPFSYSVYYKWTRNVRR